MVSAWRIEAAVVKTMQSIKEIVGNHSDDDDDIYAALKDMNMNPNETAQKLLHQDPFHEVKRRRDRRKENSGFKIFVAAEPSKNSELVHVPVKDNNHSDGNALRGGYSQNAVSGNLISHVKASLLIYVCLSPSNPYAWRLRVSS